MIYKIIIIIIFYSVSLLFSHFIAALYTSLLFHLPSAYIYLDLQKKYEKPKKY